MGLFDKIFGPKLPDITTSEQLREALIDAALTQNQKVLQGLFSRHRRGLLQNCGEWTKAPESIRNNKAAITRYADGVIAVAIALANLGEPALLEKLQGGGPEQNPMTRWQGILSQAKGLVDEWKYDQAHSLLENHLLDSRELIGTGVDRFRSITLGMIGQCHFHRGEVESSLGPVQAALQICEQSGDLEGVVAYLHSLTDIRRYLGQSVEAAALMDRLAELNTRMGNSADSHIWAGRAAVVRAGEPLCRVLVVVEGRGYEVENAPVGGDMHVTFIFERNRLSLGRSNALVNKGAELGSTGRTEEALAMFRQAAPLDPFNPEPHYQAGVGLLELGRAADAADEFRTTEELAPGWFQCRSDLWLAQQIAAEALGPEVFTVLRALQDGPGTPQQKAPIAEKAVSRFEHVAPFHLQQGIVQSALGNSDRALRAFRKGLEVAQEPDVRTRLLTQLAGVLPAGAERTAILKEAVSVKGNLVASATAAFLLRCGA